MLDFTGAISAFFSKFLYFFNIFVLVYFFVSSTIYLLLLIMARAGIVRQKSRIYLTDYYGMSHSPYTLPISVIICAYNEEKNIEYAIKALQRLEYPQYEILIVNDGSTDDTLMTLIKSLKLEPVDRIVRHTKPGQEEILRCKPIKSIYSSSSRNENWEITVVDKFNGGKADSLNAGMLVSKYPLICSIDADTLLESDALIRIVRPFMDDPDRVVASGGIVRVVNGCKVLDGTVLDVNLPKEKLVVFQIVEYLRAFVGARYTLGQLNALLIVAGAFTIFRKDIAIKVGGYKTNSMVEDMELIVDIHRYMREQKKPYKINFVPEPIAWTEVPSTVKSIIRQRIRWHRGQGEVLAANRKLFFNFKYGTLGMLILPYYLFFELFGPVVEALGYITVPLTFALGLISWNVFALFITIAFLYSAFLSVFALLLHELSERQYYYLGDIVRLFLYGLLDNFIYRPFISFVRTYALLTIWTKGKWGHAERKGFFLEHN